MEGKLSDAQPNLLTALRSRWLLAVPCVAFLWIGMMFSTRPPPARSISFHSTNDNEPPLSCPYSNSLEQMNFVSNLIKAGKALKVKSDEEPRYKVKVHRNDSAGIQLMLYESPSVFGGSLFHVEWAVYDPRISPYVHEKECREKEGFPRRIYSITTCTVQDRFNGSYSICCPKPKHSTYGCHKLNIVRYYQNFHIYRGATEPSNTTVFSKRWCPKGLAAPPASWMEEVLSRRNFPPCSFDNLSQLSSEGQWLRLDGKLEWVSSTMDCVAPNVDGYPIQSCFNNLNSLTIMGDSHMRIYSKYFLSKLYSEDSLRPQLWNITYQDFYMGEKFRFLWCCDDLAGRLTDTFLKTDNHQSVRNMTKKDVLIIETGSWGLSSYPVIYYVRRTIPRIVDVLTQIR